jgi:hypothetical protein
MSAEHSILSGVLLLVTTVVGYQFRSLTQAIHALECALKACLEKLDHPTPPER